MNPYEPSGVASPSDDIHRNDVGHEDLDSTSWKFRIGVGLLVGLLVLFVINRFVNLSWEASLVVQGLCLLGGTLPASVWFASREREGKYRYLPAAKRSLLATIVVWSVVVLVEQVLGPVTANLFCIVSLSLFVLVEYVVESFRLRKPVRTSTLVVLLLCLFCSGMLLLGLFLL